MRKKRTSGREKTSEEGMALVVALSALLLFSILGLVMSLTTTAEVRISDNHESHVRARRAALAGLEHARALLRGLDFDDQLRGPDGSYDQDPAAMSAATDLRFRSPLPWNLARTLDMEDPTAALAGIPDDGMLNSGVCDSVPGLGLIPLVGLAQSLPDPAGGGTLLLSRYFVKVTDNNGEASELEGDSLDNPFRDGDGQILVRSLGVSRTLRDPAGAADRRNTAVIFEARFKRRETFDFEAPLVLQGTAAAPAGPEMFVGKQFIVQGGTDCPGIATIDPAGGLSSLVSQVSSRLRIDQWPAIQGAGLEPSVRDMTAAISAHDEKRRLLDPAFIFRFLQQELPQFADAFFSGAQRWPDAAPLTLGAYDLGRPPGAPGQNPLVTCVHGDLEIAGDLQGAGILAVTGRISVSGRFDFTGLVLAAGSGVVNLGGNGTIKGAVWVASLTDTAGSPSWGTVMLTLKEMPRIVYDREAVRMALRLLPPAQTGFREISSIIDPW